jgi:hypothetical protein
MRARNRSDSEEEIVGGAHPAKARFTGVSLEMEITMRVVLGRANAAGTKTFQSTFFTQCKVACGPRDAAQDVRRVNSATNTSLTTQCNARTNHSLGLLPILLAGMRCRQSLE